MRVAVVVPIYLPHPGGIQKHVEELTAGLLRRSIDVDVLVQEKDGSLPRHFAAGRLTIRRFPVPISTPRYSISPALLAYLRKSGSAYDILHAHNYHELVPLFASMSRASNLVLTPHYHPPAGRGIDTVLRMPHRLLSRKVVTAFDRVICVSKAESAALLAQLPSISDRTQVIPNGVDSSRVRDAEPIDIGRPYVLSVGRLEGHKRVEKTIRAAVIGDFQVVIAGEGHERHALEKSAAGTPVRFLGRIGDDELYRWIRGAAVVVTMSEREAFGLVILEAFAAGVPVVASDIPAHRETVAYGPPKASLLVPIGADPTELARSIQRMTDTGDRRFHACVPTWDDMAAQTLSVYEELVNRSARPGSNARPRG